MTTAVTTTTTHKVFKVLGTTDEVTECQHCGRTDLKGTIRLGELDADGNVEGVTYFGAVCGAKAAGWTTKDLRKAAKTADAEWRDMVNEAYRENMDRNHEASMVGFRAWLLAEHGITIVEMGELWEHKKAFGGLGPIRIEALYLDTLTGATA